MLQLRRVLVGSQRWNVEPSSSRVQPSRTRGRQRRWQTNFRATDGTGGRERESQGGWRHFQSAPFVSLSFLTGHWLTLKYMFGIEGLPDTENKDVMDHIAECRRLRRSKRLDAALEQLRSALDLLKDREATPSGAWRETEIQDEMAQVLLDKGDVKAAGEHWRLVLSRLLHVHGKLDSDQAVIQTLLNLALVFEKQGQMAAAEYGYRQCLAKQETVAAAAIDAINRANKLGQDQNRSEAYGVDYTDPQALLGSALEHLAHFLISSPPPHGAPEQNLIERVTPSGKLTEDTVGPVEARVAEAERCIWRAADISAQISGPTSMQSITILNSFGVKALGKGYFDMAVKLLTEVVRRAVEAGEVVGHQLPAYYCNLAEALFHNGRREEALDVARRALVLSEHSSYAREYPAIRQHCRDFVAALESDCKNQGVPGSKSWEGWL